MKSALLTALLCAAAAVTIGPALLVVAALYIWVSTSQVRFEEGSIAIAAKRAAIRNAGQRGDPLRPARTIKAMPGPFPLPAEADSACRRS